ncbi:GumC family protein [Mangrovimonas sp. YM274]|uniref:GumC family protein n=1 Tax=Mangrovimonas sp. YM274 TaxID=3070660 RepID=UPI0027DCB624|nr:polysaccharide biosynthesis tyrosine autokinase [Mangrovimonas sp. YM274]WMI68433.1 polysaccharide biosynthesis tyrosine autokinase [Mangrovimonas sp. YM274]
MTNSTSKIPNNDSKIDLKEELSKYLSHWPWFLLSIAVAVLVAYFYSRYTPDTFRTTAKIRVLDEGKGLELPTSAFVFKRSSINLDNDMELIKSKRLLTKVVEDLNLTITYTQIGKFRDTELWPAPFRVVERSKTSLAGLTFTIEVVSGGYVISNEQEKYSDFSVKGYVVNAGEYGLPFSIIPRSESEMARNIGNLYLVRFGSIGGVARSLAWQLQIGRHNSSGDILTISLNGTNKKKSEDIINKVVEQFNLDGIQDRQLVHKRTMDFVDDRFVFLATELDSIEKEKEDFKVNHNLISIEADVGFSMGRKVESDQAVFDLETQKALAEFLKESLNTGDGFNLLPESIGLEDTNANNLIVHYNVLVQERDDLIVSAGSGNPRVISLEENLEKIQDNLNESINNYLDQLKVAESQIKRRKIESQGLVASVPEKETLLRAIERQQKIKETLYLFLLQKREEAAINFAITADSIKVLDNATTSGPISPDRNKIYIMAILAGLLIPLGIIYGVNYLDTKIHGKNQLERQVPEIPVIGEIPLVEDQKLFLNAHDKSMLAESFRILTTNVNYALGKKGGSAKIVYVTSTIKGEGKTFVATNLALAFASVNHKVLLIGADLRNPQLHNNLKLKKTDKGLSDYLFDTTMDYKDLIIHPKIVNRQNFSVLLAGTIPPNPSELFVNGRFETMLEELKKGYDYIVIDTAPTLLVTDTLLISQYSDVTLYVTRSNYTDKNILDFSKELNRDQKLKNLNYVLNGVGGLKSKGYGYNYGYGYGYEAYNEKLLWYKRIFSRV